MISIGRIVLYRLHKFDVDSINNRRKREYDLRVNSNIPTYHQANFVYEGETYPLLVVRAWDNEYGQGIPGVNGQVFLDGNDTHWVTSVREGTETGQWSWPERK